MDYYNEIRNKLIDNEIYSRVKDYSKERARVITYFEIGKLLYKAGSKYGESIIIKYSEKLVKDIGKKYNDRTLRSMRQFYVTFKDDFWKPLVSKLTWTNYLLIMPLKDKYKMYYYINLCIKQNLSKRQLQEKIKSKEYERLDENTKKKLITKEENLVSDFIKNPVLINSSISYEYISEKTLKRLIIEDMDSFLTELGEGFCYIKNEYKIKLGDRYNYIDLLLYNIKYKCYVVVELKVVELKSEHIGQIKKYMNYIDKNIKTIEEDNTIGIIIVKKDNKFVMEYCSDDRIFRTIYIC
ncbi:MAG: DUF1016 family protein [Bacilli bacterium]|nr:DUF1016 family protein [Bacilli bacterium]